MSVRDKIINAISKNKTVLHEKMQKEKEKEEVRNSVRRVRFSKMYDFLNELKNSTEFHQLDIEFHEHLAIEGLVNLTFWGSREAEWIVATWQVKLYQEHIKGQWVLKDGIEINEHIYDKGGQIFKSKDWVFETDQEAIDYLTENIGKWIAVIETDYDYDDSGR